MAVGRSNGERTTPNLTLTGSTLQKQRREGLSMHSLLHSLSVSVHIRVQCPEQTFCLCCSVFSLHTGQCTQSLTIFHSFFTLSQPSLCTHTCNLCRSSFRNGSLTIVFSFHGYLFIYLLMKRWPNLYVKSH